MGAEEDGPAYIVRVVNEPDDQEGGAGVGAAVPGGRPQRGAR